MRNASSPISSSCSGSAICRLQQPGSPTGSARLLGVQKRVGQAVAMVLVLALLTELAIPLHGCGFHRRALPAVNGTLLDYTDRHGVDRRIYSQALQRPQSLYVYLPPGYDPQKSYPLVIYLHAGMQDVESFLPVVAILDQLVSCGQLPPLLVAAPDGSLCPGQFGSFFINGPAGNYHDWVAEDVYSFMTTRFSVWPEPEAHVLVGASMGGFGAYNLALKHPDRFKTVVGIMPALNLRWVGACGCYFDNFHPQYWGWRQTMAAPDEPVGRFGLCGMVKVRASDVIYPAFGSGPEGFQRIQAENPIELLLRSSVQGRDLAMYIAYAGRDEFNLDAQAASFVHVARQRQLDLTVDYHPRGRHDQQTAMRMLPGVVQWLRQQLSPYVPKP